MVGNTWRAVDGEDDSGGIRSDASAPVGAVDGRGEHALSVGDVHIASFQLLQLAVDAYELLIP